MPDGRDMVTVALPTYLVAWLKSRPEGADACVEAAVKRAMDGSRPDQLAGLVAQVIRSQESQLTAALVAALVGPGSAAPGPSPPAAVAVDGPPPSPWAAQSAAPAPVTADCEASLRQIEARDAALSRRAAALVRYPQLVEAVAKELVSIERAESMAEEADARTKR